MPARSFRGLRTTRIRRLFLRPGAAVATESAAVNKKRASVKAGLVVSVAGLLERLRALAAQEAGQAVDKLLVMAGAIASLRAQLSIEGAAGQVLVTPARASAAAGQLQGRPG